MTSPRFLTILLPLLLPPLLGACRSQQQLTTTSSTLTDSVAGSSRTVSALSADSLFSSLSFSFDTLAVTISRPAPDSLPPTTISIIATRGHIVSTHTASSASTLSTTSLDSITLHRSATFGSARSTSATAIYDPPNPTPLIIALALVALAYLIFAIHSNNK
ncbi:MAG: hypothetical protein HDS21_00070 [Bacteroides sp.]|nr:hypothetical protein [Bacteroides sp.]